ncbi:MAG: hypothetical protein FVQ80_18740 [Planctomycetes bacterium]|nr:hypothetical protein [Planctomycetota bacterium]
MKNRSYHQLAIKYQLSSSRIREIVTTFWGRLAIRPSAFNRYYTEEKKLARELARIRLYNPDIIGDLLKKNYSRLVEEYNFSTRVYICFWKSGIKTIDQLVEKSEENLLRIRNLGKKSIREIKDILSDHGYSLKEVKLLR